MSCNSLKRIVPSGNTLVFSYIAYDAGFVSLYYPFIRNQRADTLYHQLSVYSEQLLRTRELIRNPAYTRTREDRRHLINALRTLRRGKRTVLALITEWVVTPPAGFDFEKVVFD